MCWSWLDRVAHCLSLHLADVTGKTMDTIIDMQEQEREQLVKDLRLQPGASQKGEPNKNSQNDNDDIDIMI